MYRNKIQRSRILNVTVKIKNKTFIPKKKNLLYKSFKLAWSETVQTWYLLFMDIYTNNFPTSTEYLLKS